ncbi:unnamed protein product, partial [Symbiodinium sp. KB8]
MSQYAALPWHNIRIAVEYVDVLQDLQAADPAQAAQKEAMLKNNIIPAVVAKLESVLQVRRKGNVFHADYDCNSYYTGSGRCASVSSSNWCGYIPGDKNVEIPAAYLGPTERDEADKPTVGRTNICPNKIPLSAGDVPALIGTVAHEFLHALGFSRDSWWRFRDPTTLAPKTPRSGTRPTSEYQTSFSCGGSTRTHYAAASNTVEYFGGRGMSVCSTAGEKVNPGNCIQKMVGQHTLDAVRWYFGCPTMTGAELENQPTSTCSLTGSHLEQRIFPGTVMTPIIDYASKIDAVTLGILEDSGWYKPVYSASDAFYMDDWGFKQGCSFANDKCVTGPKSAPVPAGSPPRWAVDNSEACRFDLKAWGPSTLSTYTSALPTQYQYFTNSMSGGSTEQYDYCPRRQAYSNRVC